MTDNDKAEITACHNEMLKNAFKGDYDMIILDEFNSAYHYGLLDKEFAKHLILNGREYCETVLTGRNPDEVFLKSADYVSEICCVRHPYKKGISARKGIEY
jgi:cob(I)alamin adenosyltransferase